ncbi:toll/interleukin-1 receptor (TIR) domain-containing protein [Artemisia annua]|uniref:Toll/interleukin-1 receptor (TIR) domain-containing protein n=1 Tax=Artemisia annua TaxID=35608 RepID=A0A2U1L5Q1_ARTAN|nr:toll/interleukin-1 receptor (TIR) domain-containing protein [Artemisia annua]
MVILTDVSQASSSANDHKFDVFLSFRGVDTRLSFTNHLHKALVNANLTTFLDDKEIDTGLFLKPELESAIRASRASIIVLSKNYATSTWCLNELVLILEQLRTSNHIVIPIFYHVEPTDVRKQQNSFKNSMEKHEERMKAETNAENKSEWARKIAIWKKALTQVADLKGMNAKGRIETEIIDETVDAIYQRLGEPLRKTMPLLIGMDDSIKLITSWLKDGSSHTTDILTIYGMGGIGKTSLANYVHKLHGHEFDKSYFIEHISRRCAQQFNGLLHVQKQLCSNISNHAPNVLECTSMIETALKRKKFFLVLDDIDSLEQLDALLGKEGFYPGSKIIITTKDASLTERCALFNMQIQTKHKLHFLGGLEDTKSLQLLSTHAFMCDKPKEDYVEVSIELLQYCEGLPLALEVLGRYLRNRDLAYWKDCIESLKKGTNSHINNVLKMSYDTLGSDYDKELFKHIACFFVGQDRDFTEIILKACNFNTTTGITHLVDRCLLSIGSNNKLTMHSLIQMMGRDVVRQESPNMPWKRSRLWCHEESFKVLRQKKGEGNLLGLALDMKMLEKEKLFELQTDSLSGMDNLMLLQLNHVQMNDQSCKNFPEELRWLCMHGFPLKYIPSELPMENLVVLDMSHSNIESFGMSFVNNQQQVKRKQLLTGSLSKNERLLVSLKILDFTFCEQLCSLGGFFKLPALERLILTNCTSLIHVCESIEHCVELVLVDLRSCYKLKRLPRTIGKLNKVEKLLLDGCDLGNSRIEMRDMDSLQTLKADKFGRNSQTSSSATVEVIPRDLHSFTISLPSSLVILSLKYSRLSNESFPMDLSCLSMLRDLYLDGNPIVSMPSCVRSLTRLKQLSMNYCKKLKTVEQPPHTLRILRITNMSGWQCNYRNLLRQICFNPEMSPLKLHMHMQLYENSSFEIQGMIKIQPLADVKERVLRNLGWTDLESIKKQKVHTSHMLREAQTSHVQMYYEFGIFSTFYAGKVIPNWITHTRWGSSISIIIPSSRNKLRGLNICSVQTLKRIQSKPYQGIPYQKIVKVIDYSQVPVKFFEMPMIIVSNITKNHTWIYNHYISQVSVAEECVILLSHWMLGKNEMEDGDQLTVTIAKKAGEEDPLRYYKSWNHIIGGDLSAFQSTTGEYVLHRVQFRDTLSKEIPEYYHPFIAHNAAYKGRGYGVCVLTWNTGQLLDHGFPSTRNNINGVLLLHWPELWGLQLLTGPKKTHAESHRKQMFTAEDEEENETWSVENEDKYAYWRAKDEEENTTWSDEDEEENTTLRDEDEDKKCYLEL